MTKAEKLEKITRDFSQLPDEKQDYILGIIQSLAFAHDFPDNSETASGMKEEVILLDSSLACASEKK